MKLADMVVEVNQVPLEQQRSCLARGIQRDPDMEGFVLLASDPFAAELVDLWAFKSLQHGGNPEKIQDAVDWAHRSRSYERKKYPD